MLRIPSAYSLRDKKVAISITGVPQRPSTPVSFFSTKVDWPRGLASIESRDTLTDRSIRSVRRRDPGKASKEFFF